MNEFNVEDDWATSQLKKPAVRAAFEQEKRAELMELAVKIVAFDPADAITEMPDCLRCGQTFTVDSLDDVTPLCHDCAHETVQELALLALGFEAAK